MIPQFLRAPDAGGTGAAPRRPRILTFSTLYPNAQQPSHGIFVENRLKHLIAGGGVSARVVAPVPWFPWRSPIFGGYADFARVPVRESRCGIEIVHPRYPLLPKFGMSLAPALMFAALLPVLRRLQAERDFDLIDAHYFYPDGVAAAMLGRALGKPVVITARGTDVNLIPRHALPRRQIAWAARQAASIVTVADALQAPLLELGVPAAKLRTLRNGVDLDLFRPLPHPARGKALLSVGHLIERKGHHLVIEALVRLPGFTLRIVGDGPERGALVARARALGVESRVEFLGSVAQERLPAIYAAADALVLASSREGWANVLLEAMACGTPVVATRAWGNPEIVAWPAAGLLMDARSAEGVADAVEALFTALPDRQDTRRYAEGFSWEATSAGQLALFEQVLAARGLAELAGAAR